MRINLPLQVLRVKLGKGRILLNGNQRRRLAVNDDRRAYRWVETHPTLFGRDFQLLISIAGVGSIAAMTVLAEIGDLCRFERAREDLNVQTWQRTRPSRPESLRHGYAQDQGAEQRKRDAGGR